jgi:hypothetical protein
MDDEDKEKRTEKGEAHKYASVKDNTVEISAATQNSAEITVTNSMTLYAKHAKYSSKTPPFTMK